MIPLRTTEVAFRVAAPRPEVFAFFADPANLDRSTPPWFRLRLRTSLPVAMAEGRRIDYLIRWRWLAFPWRSRVTQWRPDEGFTYDQARGPFRRFRHLHRFAVVDGGGTRVVDRIDWAVWGGWLVARRVERDLAAIFRYRTQVAEELFGRG